MVVHAVGTVVPYDGTFAVVDRDGNVKDVALRFNQGYRLPPVTVADAHGPFGYVEIEEFDLHAKAA